MSFRTFACLLLIVMPATLSLRAAAQGGPPYYTNDPCTPGNLNWEIDVGYMPFFYINRLSLTCPISTSILALAIASSLLMKMPGQESLAAQALIVGDYAQSPSMSELACSGQRWAVAVNSLISTCSKPSLPT